VAPVFKLRVSVPLNLVYHNIQGIRKKYQKSPIYIKILIEIHLAQEIRFKMRGFKMVYKIFPYNKNDKQVHELIYEERISFVRVVIFFLVKDFGTILNEMRNAKYKNSPPNESLPQIRQE